MTVLDAAPVDRPPEPIRDATSDLSDQALLRLGVSAIFGGFLLRLWFGSFSSWGLIFFDEFSHLAGSRLLAGDQLPELYGPRSKPLLAILVTPIEILTSDTANVYNAAQVINAAAISLSTLVLYRLMRAIFDSNRSTSLFAATIATLIPATSATTVVAISEALLILTSYSAILSVCWLSKSLSYRRGMAIGLLVGLPLLAHARGVGVVLGCTAAIVLSYKRLPLDKLVLVLTSLAATVGSIRLFEKWMNSRLYLIGSPSTPAASERLISTIENFPTVIVHGIGMLWSLTAGSAGLVPVGVVALLVLSYRAIQSNRNHLPSPVLVAILGSLVLSVVMALVFSHRSLLGGTASRSDWPIYDRYLGTWSPLLVAFALVGLREKIINYVTAFSSTLVVLIAGFLTLTRKLDPDLWARPFAPFNVMGVLQYKQWFGRWDIGLMTVSTVVVFTIFMLLLAKVPKVAGFTLAVAFVYFTALEVSGFPSDASRLTQRRTRVAAELQQLDQAAQFPLTPPQNLLMAYELQFASDQINLDISQRVNPNSQAPLIVFPQKPDEYPGARLITHEYQKLGPSLWAVDQELIADLDQLGWLFPLNYSNGAIPIEAMHFDMTVLEGDLSTNSVLLRITHTGSISPWPTSLPEGSVSVGARLYDNRTGEVVKEFRAPIPDTMRPGDTATIRLAVSFEQDLPTDHCLRLGVVHDPFAWLTPDQPVQLCSSD